MDAFEIALSKALNQDVPVAAFGDDLARRLVRRHRNRKYLRVAVVAAIGSLASFAAWQTVGNGVSEEVRPTAAAVAESQEVRLGLDAIGAIASTDPATASGGVSASAVSDAAAVLRVDCASTAETPDGASWETAFRTVQAAVAAATVENTCVLVRAGEYALASTITNTACVTAIVADSAATPRATVLDGLGDKPCVLLPYPCLFAGFTVTNGVASTPPAGSTTVAGGGIRVTAAEGAVISNCVVTGCSATRTGTALGTHGGGIALETAGTVVATTVENCSVFHKNTGSTSKNVRCPCGGGIGIQNPLNVLLTNVTVSACRAEFDRSNGNSFFPCGGGIGVVSTSGTGLSVVDAAVRDCFVTNRYSQGNAYGGGLSVPGGTVTACRVYDNVIDGFGGGVWLGESAVLNGSSVVSNNTASGAQKTGGHGGGVYLSGAARMEIVDVLCNRSRSYGGGAYVSTGSAVSNCLLKANSSARGGGLYVASLVTVSDTVMVTNEATGGAIYLATGNGTVFENCLVSNNVGKTYAGGACLSSVSNAVFRRCTFSGNIVTGHVKCQGPVFGEELATNAGATEWNTRELTVDSCVFRCNRSVGAQAWGGTGACFYLGTPVGNASKPYAATPLRVRNCLFEGNDGKSIVYATSIPDDACWRFENCTFVRNTSAAYASKARGVFMTGKPANLRIVGCAFYGNTGGPTDAPDLGTEFSESPASITYSYAPNGAGLSTDAEYHNVSAADPRFMDADAGDWRLKASSALVDAGLEFDWTRGRKSYDLTAFVYGGGEVRRWQGAAPDIGCFERPCKGLAIMVR